MEEGWEGQRALAEGYALVIMTASEFGRGKGSMFRERDAVIDEATDAARFGTYEEPRVRRTQMTSGGDCGCNVKEIRDYRRTTGVSVVI